MGKEIKPKRTKHLLLNLNKNVPERYIQLFRETLSEKITKLHKPIPKGSMGRRIEQLHVLNTNEI